MKKCRFCAEEIQDQAVKCRYCGEFLEGTAGPAKAGSQETEEPEGGAPSGVVESQASQPPGPTPSTRGENLFFAGSLAVAYCPLVLGGLMSYAIGTLDLGWFSAIRFAFVVSPTDFLLMIGVSVACYFIRDRLHGGELSEEVVQGRRRLIVYSAVWLGAYLLYLASPASRARLLGVPLSWLEALVAVGPVVLLATLVRLPTLADRVRASAAVLAAGGLVGLARGLTDLTAHFGDFLPWLCLLGISAGLFAWWYNIQGESPARSAPRVDAVRQLQGTTGQALVSHEAGLFKAVFSGDPTSDPTASGQDRSPLVRGGFQFASGKSGSTAILAGILGLVLLFALGYTFVRGRQTAARAEEILRLEAGIEPFQKMNSGFDVGMNIRKFTDELLAAKRSLEKFRGEKFEHLDKEHWKVVKQLDRAQKNYLDAHELWRQKLEFDDKDYDVIGAILSRHGLRFTTSRDGIDTAVSHILAKAGKEVEGATKLVPRE